MKAYDSAPPEEIFRDDRLTSPFGLAERLTAPRFRIDAIAFADLGFICLLALFLSQSFLFSPGVNVDLPVLRSGEQVIGVQADAVATVWDGKIVTVMGSYPIERMDSVFRDLMLDSSRDGNTLLLLTDRATPFDSLAKIYQSARKAGFAQVQMATKVDPETP